MQLIAEFNCKTFSVMLEILKRVICTQYFFIMYIKK